MEKSVPVYLFTGFLESGKTSFIQKTIDDKRFNSNDNILLLVCEEGEEEYKIPDCNRITVRYLEDSTELDPEKLKKMSDECQATVIVIEYNGMWHMSNLILNKPANWKIFETVLIADSSTFIQYSKNFGNLVSDKLYICDIVVFNRLKSNDFDVLHKLVRKVNRKSQIYYQDDSGQMISDDIEDVLPFDVNSDFIIIKDCDYALWYSDIMNSAGKYQGKTVTFKALLKNMPELPENIFALGRNVVTCCEEDMQFCWFVALYNRFIVPDENCWVSVKAEIEVRYSEKEDIEIPFLIIKDMYKCGTPIPETASFY